MMESYLLAYSSANEHFIRLNVEIENKLLESDKQVLAVSQEAIDEMKELRHDFKNHEYVLQTLLDEGKIEEAKEFLRNINNVPVLTQSFVSSGNKTIDSILNMEKLKANSYDVNIRYDVNVPKELNFTVSDISRILVNLIDNAIEETLKIKKEKNIVDVKITSKEDSLYICVKNKLSHKVNEDDLYHLNTSKEDKKNHGFGQKIVAKMVLKYNGYIEYSTNKGYFIAEVFLSMKGEN